MTKAKPRQPGGQPFSFAGVEIQPGESRSVDLACARLATSTPMSIPIKIVHGRRPGPCLWLSAVLHGDELNGLDIIRRTLARVSAHALRGTVIAMPIVNVLGFIHQSRYLPDGRDLNRSFPGSRQGSLAARVASLVMREVVSRATHGIDLHTATRHRSNVAQVRADLSDAGTRAVAEAFGAPVILHSHSRDGSLREAAARQGLPVLVFEGGEGQRFNEQPIRIGVRGVLQVLDYLGMYKVRGPRQRTVVTAQSSGWVRAPRGGILDLEFRLGERVDKGQRLGRIADAFDEDGVDLQAPWSGTVIGRSLNPVVHQGDGVVHVTKE